MEQKNTSEQLGAAPGAAIALEPDKAQASQPVLQEASPNNPTVGRVMAEDFFANPNRVLGSIATIALALFIYIIMWIACYYSASNTQEYWLDVAVLTLGIPCGWLLGTMISPTAADEEARFTRYGTAIGSFLSGYVLSESQDTIKHYLNYEAWHGGPAFRFILWVAGILIATMTTYVFREYLLYEYRAAVKAAAEKAAA